MHVLCIHGAGSNKEIFESQCALLREQLQLVAGRSMTFEFYQGRNPCKAAPGLKAVFPRSRHFYTHFDPLDKDSIFASEEHLLRFMVERGPFHGVLAFSFGSSLAAMAMILHHQRQVIEGVEGAPLFKFAAFICGIMPDLGFKNIDAETNTGDDTVNSRSRLTSVEMNGLLSPKISFSYGPKPISDPGSTSINATLSNLSLSVDNIKRVFNGNPSSGGTSSSPSLEGSSSDTSSFSASSLDASSFDASFLRDILDRVKLRKLDSSLNFDAVARPDSPPILVNPVLPGVPSILVQNNSQLLLADFKDSAENFTLHKAPSTITSIPDDTFELSPAITQTLNAMMSESNIAMINANGNSLTLCPALHVFGGQSDFVYLKSKSWHKVCEENSKAEGHFKPRSLNCNDGHCMPNSTSMARKMAVLFASIVQEASEENLTWKAA